MRPLAGTAIAVAMFVAACGASGPSPTPTLPGSSGTPGPSTSPTGAVATATEPPSATSESQRATPTPGGPAAQIVRAFPSLRLFGDPVAMVSIPGTDQLLVAIQQGWLVAFENDEAAFDALVVLDYSTNVSQGSELGLLSVAVDPAFDTSGHIYLYYSLSDPGRRTVLTRMDASLQDGTLSVDASSELVILSVDQPAGNHNGGTVAFGPDGMLYLGFGDGGGAGDVSGNAQAPARNLLGSVIRIDISAATADQPYTIPADNPFVDSDTALPETWVYGVRNPWRMSFDSETGELWLGDVGQNRFEEVDILRSGSNYGWNITEGTACFNPTSGCDGTGLTPPVASYAHGDGCTVIGGYVYRGLEVPALQGYYVYGDYCSGNVWALDAASAASGTPTQPILIWPDGVGILSFAVDAAGELYLLGSDTGIYRFAP